MSVTTRVSCVIQAFLVLLLLACFNGDTYTEYLLRCGAETEGSSDDGRVWKPDNEFLDDFNSTVTASAVTDSTATFRAPVIPFSRARIFTNNLTYKFPVSPGPKFIRLFFYPSPSGYYSGSPFLRSFSVADAYLAVQVNSGQFLLRNFSAYLSVDIKSSSYTYTELYVHANYSSLLQLTLSPTLPSSKAFINGIEVVSVPENLYVGPTNVAVSTVEFKLGISTTLQTVYRVNVAGREIGSVEDSGSMYRIWKNDDDYLIGNFSGIVSAVADTPILKYSAATPNYTAPAQVYETFRAMGNTGIDPITSQGMNLTWGFEVDLGSYYMVRLHWCEFAVLVNSTNYRIFDVYINDHLADKAVDIFERVGSDTPTYKDYVVYMDLPEESQHSGVLQLALCPYTNSHPKYNDVLLNALEIFKINQSDGSIETPQKQVSTKRSKGSRFIRGIVVFSISGFLFVAFVTCFFLFRPISAIKQASASKCLVMPFGKRSNKTGFAMSCHTCHQFSLAQLKLATKDFNEGLIIGHGGFGNVYMGTLQDENRLLFKAAIKRLNPSSKQGAHEFKTEIEMLSKIRHAHLVSLLGYCDEHGEMILVYEYMEHGTLRDHLYNTNNSPLPWNLRLSICLGAAKGLHYLHAGAGQMVIHRDVKSTNILLDENWVPKVSDFGLSKLGPIGGHLHVSTAVKGSFGYMDPEYYMLQQLTEKSDVYSFGVVLFEVLCGRAAVNPDLPFEEVNVAMWARSFQQRGALDEVLDPNLEGQVVPGCLRTFGEIAERCVRDHRTERPTMADVVWSLELALQLQQHGDITSTGDILSSDGFPLHILHSTSSYESHV